jgi:hypothetical protein
MKKINKYYVIAYLGRHNTAQQCADSTQILGTITLFKETKFKTYKEAEKKLFEMTQKDIYLWQTPLTVFTIIPIYMTSHNNNPEGYYY